MFQTVSCPGCGKKFVVNITSIEMETLPLEPEGSEGEKIPIKVE